MGEVGGLDDGCIRHCYQRETLTRQGLALDGTEQLQQLDDESGTTTQQRSIPQS